MRIFGFRTANQLPAGSPPADDQPNNPAGDGGTAQAQQEERGLTVTPQPPAVPTPPPSPPVRQPPTRLMYTRHAVVGDGDDLIVNRGWYRFLITMLWIGGTGVLFWIFFGGFQWGRTRVPTRLVMEVAPIPATSPPVPTPLASQPTIIQPVVVQPVVVQPPVPPAPIMKVEVVPPPQSAQPIVPTPPPPGELTDAERRNELLKERLRRRYGIE